MQRTPYELLKTSCPPQIENTFSLMVGFTSNKFNNFRSNCSQFRLLISQALLSFVEKLADLTSCLPLSQSSCLAKHKRSQKDIEFIVNLFTDIQNVSGLSLVCLYFIGQILISLFLSLLDWRRRNASTFESRKFAT